MTTQFAEQVGVPARLPPARTRTLSIGRVAGGPLGPVGVLRLSVPGRRSFSYAFTPDDVLWTARFVVGEAGGRDSVENQAVIWAMFNRYALFTGTVYPTFHQFVRAYSTPLQPVLKSKGAARRHIHDPNFVTTGDYYPIDQSPRGLVPAGQLRRYLELQRTPWSALPATARSLAVRALSGRLPNPGIGNASEFDDTAQYFRDKYNRTPTYAEWVDFNRAFARGRNLTWIGEVARLRQFGINTFFVQTRVGGMPPNAVTVTEPAPTSPELDRENFVGWLPTSATLAEIVDRTQTTPKDRRVRWRDPKTVYALVLHQMAFSRGSVPSRYDTVTAHYAILPDGKILQLHPVSAYLNASNGFNPRSVAVEFAGNFPNTRGKCWEAATYGCHTLSQAQIAAGRKLVNHLVRTIGLTHVLAHRQAWPSRENCPGPDVWSQVGQWAVETLGLNDGGPGFKIGNGNPIPNEWRIWGRRGQ